MADGGSLRTRIASGEVVIGTFLLAFPTVAAARVAASVGADYVLVDGEHTGFGWETMTPVLAATRAAGSVPFVRVPSASRQNLALALDMGATGLMVPMVGTAEEARAIASWARYPPEGIRGTMFGLAAHDFAEVEPVAAMRKANDEVIIMVQIETVEGLENVEEIAAVDGVDVLWVGHFDLTTSMGIPTEFTNPLYLDALDRVAAAGRASGKAVGFLASGAEDAVSLVERGFRVLAYGSDIGIYRSALRSGLGAVRQAVEGA
ncbi:HpcH/HpaI aldolase family protein [Luethyella okanaganae]|uniref:HpcH/HpaI aldolase/citrate lyase family protein n=1 Tax=Luethyella okanaganae TaxID=69372 RepID=A0ABW1VKI8_9MICO